MKSQQVSVTAEPAQRIDRTLLSPDQLHRVLERERCRADRSGLAFCLLTFKFAKSRSNRPEEGVAHFAEILATRLRLTDDAGLFGQRAVGIVLPGTGADGAWILARDLCQRLDSSATPPEVQVYTYPSAAGDFDACDLEAPEVANDSEPDSMERFFVQPLPAWKRLMDLIGASLAMLLFLPVMVAACLGIKLSSPGPMFFKQWRIGLGGNAFQMYKLRTMVVDAEEKRNSLLELNEQEGPIFKIKNDPRITPLGRMLRTTSIDELPQLWNVIKGEMSLVGPRPHLPHETAAYDPWNRRRLDVTPGLTCTWQVGGRSKIGFEDWMRMDIRYIRRRSLANDIHLIFKTIPAVLFGKGAS